MIWTTLKMKPLSKAAQPCSRSIRFFIAVSAYCVQDEAIRITSRISHTYRESVPMAGCDYVNQYVDTVPLEELVGKVFFL